jgi:nitroimidazol reductase NimA-like FMN-containing flavoprotein (pyridoxamine 5'-phosphate oxidase superfamily)
MSNELHDLPREECLRLLAENGVGRLAVNGGSQAPVIRPVNYAFDEPSQSVVFRTAPGSKFYALLRRGTAAFEVDGFDGDARTGWSVIIVGSAEEVTNPADLRRLDGLGLSHWAPGEKPHWARIRAWTVSGRRIEARAAGAST